MLKLFIDDDLLNKILSIAMQFYPNEFGGFLVGYYSSDQKSLTITNYILPTKYQNGKFSFERSSEGIEKEFSDFFNNEVRQYYVGEWHSHPNSSTDYSTTDLKAMINIADSESIRITNPVLLILNISKNKLNNYDFYLYDNKKLFKYEK